MEIALNANLDISLRIQNASHVIATASIVVLMVVKPAIKVIFITQLLKSAKVVALDVITVHQIQFVLNAHMDTLI